MRKTTAFSALILLLIGVGISRADTIALCDDVLSNRPEVEILYSDADQVQYEVSLPSIELSETTLDGRRWDRAAIPGCYQGVELGTPEVPHFTRLIAIPATKGLRVEYEPLESVTFHDLDLIPTQTFEPDSDPNSTNPRHFNEAVYSTDAPFPAEDVVTGEPALLHGLRVAAVQVNPVKYNPVTRDLTVAQRFRVTVHFEGTDLRNAPARPMRPVSRTWAKVMRQVVINWDELDIDETVTGSYLIVCENDANLVNNLLSGLIDWKIRKGHTVVVETFSPGSTNSQIKSIIQNAYNTWEIPPEYVLLIGDTSGDYALPGWSPDGIDHPYSQLDGTDILADVAVGRIPVDDAAQAVALFNKVLWYEKMPYTGNDQWYHQGCLVAGSYLSGLSTIQTNRWIKTRMLENQFTRIDTFWYNMGSGSVNDCIVNAINDGVTFVNYRGWVGMENFSTTSIDNLTNGFMLPFTTTITCGTGGFDGDSFMEHFISVGSAVTPKGSVASVGTATTGTHTRYNNTVDIGIYAGLFDEGITQAGNALVRGKLEIYNAYNSWEPSQVSNYSLWNALAGDPGLELFTGAIRYMNCNVPTYKTWGENSLTLTVTESGGGALADAVVCYYKEGELHEVGLTDASGEITLPLNLQSPGNVKITITKHNYYPIVDSLDVLQMGVAVGYYDHIVDDDANGSSNGDGDGVINPAEDVEIPLIFKNYGSSYTATNISVTASTDDPFVTLNDNYETFPDLGTGATGTSYDDLDLSIAPECPHGHTIHLDLATTSDQGSWDGEMELEVISYDMTVLSAFALGSDTLLAPGETADFYLMVRNDGGKTANSLTATVRSLDPDVIVNDDYAVFGTVNIGGTVTATDPFNLTGNSTAIVGDPAQLEITYTNDWGSIQVDTITIYLGTKTSTDPQGPDDYGYYCFDNTDVYPQAPTYQWVEIDPAYGGSGTQLGINDPGNEYDDSEIISLPFTFRYYGEEVNHITVCSNGWIATHDDDSFTDFRNYPIPSAMGPRGMIAPFWDDLYTWTNGHVFSWYDTDNNRFIVEWSRLKNAHNTSVYETFEVILYDPAFHPTPTGDGEILFQYNQISEVYYYDNPYSTIGIESPDQQDGIEIVYWNTYDDPAAAHVQNNRAYFFTTNASNSGSPPVIGVSPTSLAIDVPVGGTGSEILTISNSGETYLTYDINFSYDGAGDASGGPDDFGYTWIDSDEPGGPTYNWVDISGIGSMITFEHNDSTTAEMPIGFTFPFYGEAQSSFIVSANGWISFSSHSNAWSNTGLPDTGAPYDLIAGFWDDLDPLQTGAEIYYYTNNSDSLIVSFISVPHYGSVTVGTYTFQMILTDDGTITYQYQTLTGNYESCTVGIQNDSGTDGLQIAYNEPYLHDGLAIQITNPFLRAVPSSGSVAGGQSMDVEVIASGYGMEPGTYTATLGIDCNDPATPHVDVPVTINVTSGNPGMVVELTYNSGSPVPPSGGNLYFDVYVANNSGTALDFDAWLDIEYEGGPPTTVVQRSFTNYQPGWTINRPNMFFPIPGSYAAGNYMFYGRVGIHPDIVWDESGFPFVKSGDDYDSSFQPFVPDGVPDPFDQIITGEPSSTLPTQFAFYGCYPNPFNPNTTVRFDLPDAARVVVDVYDLMGRRVAQIQDGVMEAGSHALHWDAGNLASGVYFLTFRSGNFATVEKLLLLK